MLNLHVSCRFDVRTAPQPTVMLSVLLFMALISATATAETTAAPKVRVLVDIPYKSSAATEYERERCTYDLYLPGNQTGYSTLVWFHGGGLRNGHKADRIAVGLAQRFASEGIAVASVNYRLSPKAGFPAYIDDAAAAVAVVQKSIPSHGGASERVFVSGHSAGGYLTAMIGMDLQYLKKYGVSANSIAGYIPVAGQMVTHSTVRGERGIPRTQPIIDAAAPLFHVRQDTSPFLCIAGGRDLPARAEENRYFVAAMKAADHKSTTYLEVEDRDHGTIASRMTEQDDVVAAAIKNFIARINHIDE